MVAIPTKICDHAFQTIAKSRNSVILPLRDEVLLLYKTENFCNLQKIHIFYETFLSDSRLTLIETCFGKRGHIRKHVRGDRRGNNVCHVAFR